MVEPGGDDDHLPPGQLDVDGRDADPVEQQRPLLAHELGGVGGERLELVGEARLGLDQRVGDRLDVLLDAAGELELPGVDDALVQPDAAAVLDRVQGVGADGVDEGDARVDEDLRPEVGEAPGDRRRRVDDGRDPGGDERVGGGPVEIDLVEHGDLARLDAADERVGAAVDARGARDAG